VQALWNKRCAETVEPQPLRRLITPDRVWGKVLKLKRERRKLRRLITPFSLKPFLKRLVITPLPGVFDQTFSKKVCGQAFFKKACDHENSPKKPR
jgi:hypothetical protein